MNIFLRFLQATITLIITMLMLYVFKAINKADIIDVVIMGFGLISFDITIMFSQSKEKEK
jgi:hypothetical protein